MTTVPTRRLTYQEAVAQFTWDEVIAWSAWPFDEKYNLAHELCDRWVTAPGKADQPALRFEDQHGTQGHYTYRQLQALSNQVANMLTDLGVQKGDRVAGLLPKTPAIVPAVLGTWKVGAVYVPLFTAFATPAVAYRLAHSDATAVITDDVHLAKVREGRHLGDGLPTLQHVLVVTAASTPLDEGLVNFWAAVHQASPLFAVYPTTPDDLLVMQYTSGSTGNPKGAMLPHKVGLALYSYMRYAIDLREEDVFWGGADPGWVHGLLGCLLGPLLLGHCALLIDAPFQAEVCWQVMERYGVTNFVYVPAVYRALATAGAAVAKQYTLQLQRASSAGEPLDPAVMHWFQEVLNVPVYDQYGQTELLILVCNYHAFDMPVKPGSMGLPMPGCRVGLVDEHGHEVGINAIGQIAMDRTGFAYMFQGYWQEPLKSAENRRGRWHLTGDLARQDAEGYFWFVGRADDLMNSSGYRIGPGEIENVLLEHPDVVEAAVISVPDPQRGEVIKAYVVLQPGVQGNESFVVALQQMVRERIGRHAVPRAVECIDALPKTPSGKMQRFLLRNANKQPAQTGSA